MVQERLPLWRAIGWGSDASGDIGFEDSKDDGEEVGVDGRGRRVYTWSGASECGGNMTVGGEAGSDRYGIGNRIETISGLREKSCKEVATGN